MYRTQRACWRGEKKRGRGRRRGAREGSSVGEFLTTSAIVVIGGGPAKRLEGQSIDTVLCVVVAGGSSSATLLPGQKKSM